MLEIEKTYLAKELPKGLEDFPSKEIIDIYVPAIAEHPILRIRKNGDKYEITKKTSIIEEDLSQQGRAIEETIHLTEDEFKNLSQSKGKKVRKFRYYYDWKGRTAEIDIFQDDLVGLVMVDFEFKNEKEMADFKMPSFCLADVTQETFAAGGMLCSKSYKDIEKDLDRFGYKKIL